MPGEGYQEGKGSEGVRGASKGYEPDPSVASAPTGSRFRNSSWQNAPGQGDF